MLLSGSSMQGTLNEEDLPTEQLQFAFRTRLRALNLIRYRPTTGRCYPFPAWSQITRYIALKTVFRCSALTNNVNKLDGLWTLHVVTS